MTSTPDDIAESVETKRRFIRRLLTGEITEATHPNLFYEGNDALVYALAYLVVHDRAWLDAQLVDEAYPQAGRDLVREHIAEVHVSGRS